MFPTERAIVLNPTSYDELLQKRGIQPPTKIGSWGSITRTRKGYHYDLTYDSLHGYSYDQQRLLSYEEMWFIYRRVADVRACIDSIVRRVATFDWRIIPTISPQSNDYQALSRICEDAKCFLQKPNTDGYTWQEIMTAYLTDTMVFDSGAIEKVFDMQGNLRELVPIRGSTIVEDKDEYGRLKGYNQVLYREKTPTGLPIEGSKSVISFQKNQIMQMSLFRNTAMGCGNPILESLVNEILTIMKSTQHSLLAMDADEIPPGILVLAGFSGKAAEDAKAEMQKLKGQDHKIRVMTTPDPNGAGARWLELRRTPKDLGMRDVIDDFRRTIFRVFGVMPVEMGITDSIPRATATVQMDVASSHLVTPILELLQAKINSEIIPALIRNSKISKYIKFEFDRKKNLSPEDQLKVAQRHAIYLQRGVMTINEAREDLGLLPLIGGDIPTLEWAGQPKPVRDIVKEFEGQDVEAHPIEDPDINDKELDAVQIEEPDDDVVEIDLGEDDE